MLVCPKGQMGALEARPQVCPRDNGVSKHLAQVGRASPRNGRIGGASPGCVPGTTACPEHLAQVGARPQDASQGRRRQAPVRWVRLQAGPYYDAGPSCARPGQARGTASRKCQPSAFFHTRLRGKGQR